jgi:protein TonB
MLHPFVSVSNPNRGFAPVLALSASVHAGLLYAALTSTGVVHRPPLRETVAELVRFAELPLMRPPSAARGANAGGRRRSRADTRPVFTLPPLPVSFDLALPEPVPLPDYLPDYTAVELDAKGVLADDVLHLGVGLAASRVPTAGPYGAYDEILVEKAVRPVADNRKPRYPPRLISRGIETRFNVTFVVDTSGRVDRETVELPHSIEQEFASAVEEALSSWRFAPAELGGHRVRQRVLQPFMFRVERQFGSLVP